MVNAMILYEIEDMIYFVRCFMNVACFSLFNFFAGKYYNIMV